MPIRKIPSSAILLVVSVALVVGGCDFGAARDAVESVGVIVELDSIETTVSGQFIDAATGELVESPVTLKLRGPDGDAAIDMYSDPISSQTISGGITSFGIQNARQPAPDDPIRIRVVAHAEDYHTTSETFEVHEDGNKEFTLTMVRSDPNRQPEGATGIRDRSNRVRAGQMTDALTLQTPDEGTGTAALYLPDGSTLRTSKRPTSTSLTVDLSYYPTNEATLDALPGNGTMAVGSQTERFNLAGYLNLQIRNGTGTLVSKIETGPEAPTPQMKVHLPAGASNPSSGTPIRAGDELTLYRYDAETGLWQSDTSVSVVYMAGDGSASSTSHNAGDVGHDLGIIWNPWTSSSSSKWWAWGTPSESTCDIDAQLQIHPNGQSGGLNVTLQRSGLQYSGSTPVEDLANQAVLLSGLLDQSKASAYQDYELVLTTRDGETQTVQGIDPCSGTYSTSLPAPSSAPRTDALFRGYPECPGNQKVRITSVPTVTVYYRETEAPSGAPWHTADDEKIAWVMDDPDNPTYIRWAELRLDGLKQDTRYDMYTTYDGERYEASALVPSRQSATIVEDRVLVEYNQDFSSVCS